MSLNVRRYRLKQRGRPIDAWIAGDGPPVVLLHGFGLSGRTYLPALREIARLGRRAVAPSASVLDPPWSIERVAAHVAETLGVLDAYPAPVVGHSFGGAVAVQLAHDCDGVVRALVIVDSLMVSPGIRTLARTVLPGPQYRIAAHTATAAALGAAILSRQGRHSLRAAARWVMTQDLTPQIQAIRKRGIPAAVLWAEGDTLLPVAAGRRAAALFGVPLDLVRATNGWPDRRPPDHDWPLRAPAFFAKRIMRTVRALERRAAGEGAPAETPAAPEPSGSAPAEGPTTA